jgi:hypothetical protein
MLSKRQVEEIVIALSALPPERVSEAQDFIFFLKERYGYDKSIDHSEAWSDEDLNDLTTAVLANADQSL